MYLKFKFKFIFIKEGRGTISMKKKNVELILYMLKLLVAKKTRDQNLYLLLENENSINPFLFLWFSNNEHVFKIKYPFAL